MTLKMKLIKIKKDYAKVRQDNKDSLAQLKNLSTEFNQLSDWQKEIFKRLMRSEEND